MGDPVDVLSKANITTAPNRLHVSIALFCPVCPSKKMVTLGNFSDHLHAKKHTKNVGDTGVTSWLYKLAELSSQIWMDIWRVLQSNPFAFTSGDPCVIWNRLSPSAHNGIRQFQQKYEQSNQAARNTLIDLCHKSARKLLKEYTKNTLLQQLVAPLPEKQAKQLERKLKKGKDRSIASSPSSSVVAGVSDSLAASKAAVPSLGSLRYNLRSSAATKWKIDEVIRELIVIDDSDDEKEMEEHNEQEEEEDDELWEDLPDLELDDETHSENASKKQKR